jgi:hypothetical protein
MREIAPRECPPCPTDGRHEIKVKMSFLGMHTDYDSFEDERDFRRAVSKHEFHSLAADLLSALAETAPVSHPVCCADNSNPVTTAQCSQSALGSAAGFWLGIAGMICPLFLLSMLTYMNDGSAIILFIFSIALEVYGIGQFCASRSAWRKKFPADDGETQAVYFTTVLRVLERYNNSPTYMDRHIFVGVSPNPAVPPTTHICSPDFKARMYFYLGTQADLARASFAADVRARFDPAYVPHSSVAISLPGFDTVTAPASAPFIPVAPVCAPPSLTGYQAESTPFIPSAMAPAGRSTAPAGMAAPEECLPYPANYNLL